MSVPPRPVAYCVLETRWDGYEHYRIRMSDGTLLHRWAHCSEHAPYFHFGASDDLRQSPPLDVNLAREAT